MLSRIHNKGRKLTLFTAAISIVTAIFLVRGLSATDMKSIPDGCTTVTVGRLASADGSVMTSHTCDGHDGRTWLEPIESMEHRKDELDTIYMRTDYMVAPGDTTGLVYNGAIPYKTRTYGNLWAIYSIINQHQLAIGESTFGGKEELKSDKGMINCYELSRIMAERCRTAREAIKLAGRLLKKYGYNDDGECLSIADTKEVWHFEVVGPGEGKVGAVWAAQRVPDGNVSVNANASRIRELDLDNEDYFMASENVYKVAKEMGLWDKNSGKPFEFCYVYADRRSMWARRREWRVFDLVAPSLNLDPNGENFPFSVKPDKKVSLEDMYRIFGDYYEGTEYDMTKFMTVKDEEGKAVKSPYANPFMNYDQMPLWKINGSLHGYGERTIARFYCIYVFISQSRDWLPDPIGGVAWFGWDNPATTCYAPLYCCTRDLPDSYKIGGEGGRPAYTRESSWWAFNRVSTIASHRWGDMRDDVAAVRNPIRVQALADQKRIEDTALMLYKEDPEKAIEYLSNYSYDFCEKITEAYWKLGDKLWTKYDEKF